MRRPTAEKPAPWTRAAAYRYCEELARSHYENFTVGSWLLPREQRRHVYAIYAYSRGVDDLGDEESSGMDPSLAPAWLGDPPAGDADSEAARRLRLLDWWQQELAAAYSGTPTHPAMVALQETIRTFDIPPEPFLKLIEANRMDQRVQRYPTYPDLLRYCDHSANPVGHLFLYLFGYRDEQRQRLSDATCTALQLTNFWQDVARDYAKGRVYLPQEDLARFGYTEEELARGVGNDAFRRLLAFQVQRTLQLFREGAPLVETLQGPARLDVALFTRGGVAALQAIRRQNYDVFSARPTVSRGRKGAIFLASWLTGKLGLKMRLPS